MKVYVLTEIDLRHVGFSPNTVQIFPSNEMAVEEMKRMYEKACTEFGTTQNHQMYVLADGGYAYVGEDYCLDIYECEIAHCGPLHNLQEITVVAEKFGVREKLMSKRNMSRPDVWQLMQEWAEEFEERYKGYDYCANNTSVYDEIDAFVQEKNEDLEMPELRADQDVIDYLYLCDEDKFGDGEEHPVTLHIYDGYAEGDGVRLEFPKLADLTPAQIAEIDADLGGRIKDSGFICPDDVCIALGKVVCFGIMDTGQNHDPELVRRINLAWMVKKEAFRPILCALYERDLDEITDHDAFKIPAWEEWKEYNDGLRSGEWDAYNDRAFSEMQTNWEDYAGNYLMHIADGKDLQCILDFVRG